MTEKRASSATGSYAKAEAAKAADPAARPAEQLARLSDHLGRLLGHADELLAEWQAHADGVRARLDAQAREAGTAFQEAVEDALAETGKASVAELQRAFGAGAGQLRADLERARQAAADLEAHMRRLAGGAGPTSVDELRAALQGLSAKVEALRRAAPRAGVPWAVLLAGSANVLVLVVLGLVWVRTGERPAELAPAPAPVVVVVPDAPPAPPPPVRPRGVCGELAGDSAPKLVAECVARLCGGARVEVPVKPGAYAKLLAACRPEEPAGRDLVSALLALERDRVLEKLACPPEKDEAGRPLVTVRWLLDCPLAR